MSDIDPEVLELKAKLEAWMAEDFGSQVTSTAPTILAVETASVHVFVYVRKTPGGQLVIQVGSPILFRVPRTPEFLEWAAYASSDIQFGSFWLTDSRRQTGSVDVLFQYSILGHSVDRHEFRAACAAVFTMADDCADLQSKFGGDRFDGS